MENLHGHHHLHQAAAHNPYQYQYQYAPVASTTATLSTPQGPPPLSLTHPSHHHVLSGSSQLLLGQHHHPHVHHHHLTHPLTTTPSLAATMNPSPLSNSSSSSINAESVTTGGSLRRDTEVERLRFRYIHPFWRFIRFIIRVISVSFTGHKFLSILRVEFLSFGNL